MHACGAEYELRVPMATSLKDKRAAIRPILEGARHRFGVSAAEVGLHDVTNRAGIGFAVVAESARQVDEILDRVDRFVWSFPAIEVVVADRYWVDTA